MSDIHVLDADGSGHVRVAFHFPVPDASNSVGVNYRVAVVNSGIGGTTAMTEGDEPGQIATAEKTQIEAGEVFEELFSPLLANYGDTIAEKRSALLADYAARKSHLVTRLAARLAYFGYTADEED